MAAPNNGYKTLGVSLLSCICTRIMFLLVGYGRASQSPTFHTRETLYEMLGRLPTAMKDTCAKREEKLALLERPTSMAGYEKD